MRDRLAPRRHYFNGLLDLSPLIGLEKKLVRKICAKAQRKAAKIVLKAAKAEAAHVSQSGAMVKSMNVRVRTYKSTVVAIVGPRSKYSVDRGVFKKGKNKGKPKLYKPSKIFHIVERGSKRSRKHPIMQPALSATGTQYTEQFCALVKQFVAQELASKSA